MTYSIHDGAPHGGGALTTCRSCAAIADDIVRRAIGAPTRRWYVSARYGSRSRLLAGPYDSVADAIVRVDAVRGRVGDDFAGDPRAAFAGYGVASSFDDLDALYGRAA